MKKNDTVWKKYILCLNRAVISFVCATHFLNVIAWEDVILNSIFSFIGKGGFIYLLIQTLQLMTTYDTQLKHEHTQQKQLEEYTRYKKLPRNIQKRLHLYCNYISKKNIEGDKHIFSDITPKLREELTLYIHTQMLTSVELLKFLPQSIVIEIASLIQTKVYSPNDVIIQSQTTGRELFFIVSGTVAVYTSSGKEICHLEEGDHFGEIAIVMDYEYRIANVVAIETCEVGILTQADFQKVIKPYPYIINRLKKLARKRLKSTLRLEKIADIGNITVPDFNINDIHV